MWATTPSGARMPLDPEPVPDGNLLARRDSTGQLQVRQRVNQAWPDEHPARSHFATCPNAGQHRKATT